MHKELKEKAIEVLKFNDMGNYTRPAPDLYPHQWLWDSCFSSIGWSYIDTNRAQKEIYSFFRGQWSNGMIPHMIFSTDKAQTKQSKTGFWESNVSPYAPTNIETSGITQPPLMAEAVARVGEKLSLEDRKNFYKRVYPRILAHHKWIYRERNPHAEGLAILIHPWENGLDNSPPWVIEMHKHQKPWWIKAIEASHFDVVIERLRRDTKQVSAEERASTIDSLILYNVVRRLKRKQYDAEQILLRSHFLIEDLFFNCILVRNNKILGEIAKEIGATIPTETQHFMNKSTKSLEELWDRDTGQYYSRNFVTRKPIMESTIATLMPLYAGTITKRRAEELVRLLKDEHQFGLPYPIPSVPLKSKFFNPRRYWQGPTWVNTNWLIIDGLKRYGYHQEANRIKNHTIELAQKSGFHEYFSPLDGYGAGIQPFSWTAALIIDLLEN